MAHDPPVSPATKSAKRPVPARVEAGRGVLLHFQVRDAAGRPVTDLEPYLGAMGHCVILAADPAIYLHTHPLHAGSAARSSATRSARARRDSAPGTPPPSSVVFHTIFLRAGLYKLWGQFQHRGKIVMAPFVLDVAASTKASTTVASTAPASQAVPGAARTGAVRTGAALAAVAAARSVPAGAQRVAVTVDGGYVPARVAVKVGRPVAITFNRKPDEGCGDEVVFPALGLRKKLPAGKTVVVFTPKQRGTLRFTCGMEMYAGTLVVR
jgi:hypothetical protein